MSEHLSQQQVESYHERRLSPAELLTADDHLAACEECRRRVGVGERLQAAFTLLRAGFRAEASAELEHLPYEQFAAYVDNTLDEVDREIVESHLELCPRCAAEARDLFAFRTLVTVPPEGAPAPAAPRRWRDRLRSLWRPQALAIPLQTTGAAAAALLVVWLATRPLHTQLAGLQAQVSRLQQTNGALQQQLARTGALATRLARLERETQQIRRDYRTAREAVAQLHVQLAQLQRSRSATPAPAIRIPQPEAGNRIVVALEDGAGRVTLDERGNLGGLASLPPSLRKSVRDALQRQQVTPRAAADLIGRAGTLMGPSEGVPFALVSPVGTAVKSDRPAFRWRPLPDATSYRVTVTDEAFKVIAHSGPLSRSEWRPPRTLPQGRVYLWQVSASRGGREIVSPVPPAPEAKFKVLEPAEADELARVGRRYANSHLTLGIVYAQAGLLDDAERELRALAEANPQSPVARRLLHSVEALRGKGKTGN